jgi:hypothetical protein
MLRHLQFSPQAGLAKEDFAAGRQVRFADAPASHLLPIEDGPYCIRHFGRNVRGRFSVQNPKRQRGGVCPNDGGDEDETADAAEAQEMSLPPR